MNFKPLSSFRYIRVFCSLSLLLAAGAVAQDSKENAEFKLAVSLYGDGMFDLAADQFKNFVAAYPSTAQGIEARFYLGLTQLKLKRYDEARATFQNFALSYVDHPKAPEAWQNVGAAFAAAGNLREAASAYERIKVFHPKSPLVPAGLLSAAELYRKLGERESARKALRSIVQDHPSSSSVLPARLALSEMYAEEGQIDLAEREARRVSQSDAPPAVKAGALFSLGRIQASSSLFNDAARSFGAVLTTYKNTPVASAAAYELGLLEAEGGAHAKAIEHLKTAADNERSGDSLQALAMMAIGRAQAAARTPAAARRSFEIVYEKFPHSPEAPAALLEGARVTLALGEPREALVLLRRLLEMPPSPLTPDALLAAARTARQAGLAADAARYYTQYLDQAGGVPDVQIELGRLYQDQLRDCRKAIVVYDQLHENSPQTIAAKIGIAECEESLGNPEGALRLYAEVQQSYPAHDRYDDIAARMETIELFTLKRRDQGIEKLARLMGDALSGPSKASVAFGLGEIYFNDLKDYEAAAKQFTSAIENGLDAAKAVDASYWRARSYDLLARRDSSQTGRAEQAYAAFLQQYPGSAWSGDAAYYRFLLTARSGAPAEIVAAGQAFLSQGAASPHAPDVILRTAAAHTGAGNPSAAIELLKPLGAQAEPLVQMGRAHALLGRTDSAQAAWRRGAGLRVRDRGVLECLEAAAAGYEEAGNLNEAITMWQRIAGEFPYTSAAANARARLPQALVEAGRHDEAIALLRGRPADEQGEDLYLRALAEERRGDRQKATQLYHQFLRTHRTGTTAGKAYYALGGMARAQSRNEVASAYFKEAAAAGGSAPASPDIADLLLATGQSEEAAGQYLKLAEADSTPKRQRYLSRAIVASYKAGRLADADRLVTQFEKAYGGRTADRIEFTYEKANYYYGKQDYTTAKKLYEKAADDGEDTRFGPWGEYYVAKIAEVTNKAEDAAKRYEAILKKHPASDVRPRVLLSLGNMHFNAERFEKAIACYQQIADSPDQAGDILPYAMNNLIEAYESTKLYDAALKVTREFIERFPNDETIIDKKMKIGTLYTRIGYYDQAVVHFQNLLDEAGSSAEAEIHYAVGEAYYYKGDYQQAILEFLKVPYLVARQGKVDWTATAFYMAGQAYEKMSKYDEAIGMYQQILERPGIDATFKAGARKEIDRVKAHLGKEAN